MKKANPGRSDSSAWKRPAWYLAPAIILWLVPVVALIGSVLAADAIERRSVVADPPAVVTVGSREFDHRQAISITATLAQASSVASPRDGIVTRISIAPGTTLVGGTDVIQIDGVTVKAFRGAVPLYRPLQLRDRGDDVASLTAFLADIGVLSRDAVSPDFGPLVDAAVRRFQQAVGAAVTGVFTPESVFFVPDGKATVAGVEIQLGDRVASGDDIFTSTQSIERVSIESLSEGDALPDATSATYAVRIAERIIPISSSAPTGLELGGLIEALDEGVASSTITADNSEDNVRRYEGAFLVLAEPQIAGSVPGSAIYVGSTGVACIFVASRAGLVGEAPVSDFRDFEPEELTTFEASGTEIGATLIDSRLIGFRVLRNPQDLPASTVDLCR